MGETRIGADTLIAHRSYVLLAVLLIVTLSQLRGNPWYALAAVWGLVGVYVQQQGAPLDGAPVASGIALSLAVIAVLQSGWLLWRNSRRSVAFD